MGAYSIFKIVEMSCIIVSWHLFQAHNMNILGEPL